MVVEKFNDGNVLYDHEINNKLSLNGNVLIGRNGVLRIDVPIISGGDVPKVRLYLRGLRAGGGASSYVHGAPKHSHTAHNHEMVVMKGVSGNRVYGISSGEAYLLFGLINYADGGDSGHSEVIDYTNVPKTVEIWVDGTEYTATIGDPNSKGSTMYDSTNNAWGVDGTTEWSTGELDLSGLITWGQGEHYVELKETGGVGGVLIYLILVN